MPHVSHLDAHCDVVGECCLPSMAADYDGRQIKVLMCGIWRCRVLAMIRSRETDRCTCGLRDEDSWPVVDRETREDSSTMREVEEEISLKTMSQRTWGCVWAATAGGEATYSGRTGDAALTS
jgi:hypothetical protein